MTEIKQATTIQSIILSKDIFKTLAEAKKWIEDNDLRSDKVDETENTFRFRQSEPEDFEPDRFGPGEAFRIITLTEGVQATIGTLKEGKASGKTKNLNPGGEAIGIYCDFVKVDKARRIVEGPALVPNVMDLQGDFELAEDIEETAHKFLSDFRNIGEMHRKFTNIGALIESWILRQDIQVGKRTLPKGTWMVAVKVLNDATWKKVETGELRGFSIGYTGRRHEVTV